MHDIEAKLTAYSDGEMAFARGRNFLRDNPYDTPTLREYWRRGFKDCSADKDERFVNEHRQMSKIAY